MSKNGTDGVPQRVPRKPRNPHKGVLLLPPKPDQGNPSWRLRWVDPDTRKRRGRALAAAESIGEPERRRAAIEQWRVIQLRRNELAVGGAAFTDANVLIETAFSMYFDTWGKRRAERTQADYRDACNLFLAWAKVRKITKVRQITRGVLNQFAASRIAAPKLGGATQRRGKRTEAVGVRAVATSNREIGSLRNVLSQLRRMDIVRISRDDLGDGLQKSARDSEKREFLRPDELQDLIAACRKHDAQTFKMTRSEKEACNWDGQATPRYKPILPVVLFYLLSGARVKEGFWLEGHHIGLDADVILVPGAIAKTRTYRNIDLSVSPLLRWVVSAAARSKGRIFANWTKHELTSARRRLIRDFDAPKSFTYQALRCSCGTYAANSGSVYGTAADVQSALRLGHSTQVAREYYVGQVRVPLDAKTIEDAMRLGLSTADTSLILR